MTGSGRLVADLSKAAKPTNEFRVDPVACDLAVLVREQVDLAQILVSHPIELRVPDGDVSGGPGIPAEGLEAIFEPRVRLASEQGAAPRFGARTAHQPADRGGARRADVGREPITETAHGVQVRAEGAESRELRPPAASVHGQGARQLGILDTPHCADQLLPRQRFLASSR
jgi:hypothetical protein